MLGRFMAGLLCVLVTVLLSGKQTGVNEAERIENHIRAAIETFLCETEKKAELTKEDIEVLKRNISLSGVICDVEIEIGTIIYGRNQNTIEVSYNETVMDELFIKENDIDLRNRMISVFVIPKTKPLAVKLANMFWESYKESQVFVSGGFIHG